MTLSIIAAINQKRGIGYQNKLLYWLPNDLKRFKALTTGHTIIMGRHTFESLPKGALPNRRNVVLSRQELHFEGAECFHTLADALHTCKEDEEVFIIGGATLYTEALPLADRLYLTEVDDKQAPADAFFPEVSPELWKEKVENAIRQTKSISTPIVSWITNVRKISVAILIFIIRQIHYRHLALDSFTERNNCFRARQAQRLKFIVDNFQQVMIVLCINLDEHVILPCRKMTFHYLRNKLQSFRYSVKLFRILQIQTDVSTGFITYLFRINDKF